jgi:hypothetical protein
MKASPCFEPDVQSLRLGLTSVFGFADAEQITIVERERNPYSSGSLSEIVSVTLAGGCRLQLLIKYSRDPREYGQTDSAEHGFVTESWSDVPYEAKVYRHLLEPLRISAPKFYGTYTERATGRLWLVLEYLHGAVPMDELVDDPAVALAAKWLGEFHAAAESHASQVYKPFLKQVNREHYSVSARRAMQHGLIPQSSSSWLTELCRNVDKFTASVWPMRTTLTHGDFYQNNILILDGMIRPVDWEHAAIDLGEMDLACLTYGWPDDVRLECEFEYQRSRWPEGAPSDFETVMNLARLRLCVEEVGSLPQSMDVSEHLAFVETMHSLGERLGLI